MPYSVVRKFEKTIAEYCGARHGVAVSSCTNAIFLCLIWYRHAFSETPEIQLPSRTYIGVACSAINAGYKVEFDKDRWKGSYWLSPLAIRDSALQFKRDMHKSGFTCISFHIRKHIPIGRGGMILTDDGNAAEWLRKARYDGREEKAMQDQRDFDISGYNMYMSPDQAARGLQLFDLIKDKDLPDMDDYETYPDLTQYRIFK